MPKLVMTDREKVYFQKLPKDLRERIAQALDQPDLIPPDKRKNPTHWAEKRALKCYVVKVPGEKQARACSLQEAAYIVGVKAQWLDEELDRLNAKKFGPRAYVNHDEVSVEKTKPH